MHFRPDLPMHDRYAVTHDFLTPEIGDEVVTIGRLVNAFFRWEFNSCETLVRGGDVYPIDYANASPDVALTSLHYYFPWAMTALVKWTVFCVVTGRTPRLDLDTRRYFEIGDRDDLTYDEKLAAYRRLTDEHFDTERYRDFCASRLPHVDEIVLEWVASAEFDALLVDTVRSLYPAHEHEQFIGHFRGLIGQWVRRARRRAGALDVLIGLSIVAGMARRSARRAPATRHRGGDRRRSPPTGYHGASTTDDRARGRASRSRTSTRSSATSTSCSSPPTARSPSGSARASLAAAEGGADPEERLRAMGEAYLAMIGNSAEVLCQLQAYAAAGDPALRETIRDEFVRLFESVRETAGVSREEAAFFIAGGIFLAIATALGVVHRLRGVGQRVTEHGAAPERLTS